MFGRIIILIGLGCISCKAEETDLASSDSLPLEIDQKFRTVLGPTQPERIGHIDATQLLQEKLQWGRLASNEWYHSEAGNQSSNGSEEGSGTCLDQALQAARYQAEGQQASLDFTVTISESCLQELSLATKQRFDRNWEKSPAAEVAPIHKASFPISVSVWSRIQCSDDLTQLDGAEAFTDTLDWHQLCPSEDMQILIYQSIRFRDSKWQVESPDLGYVQLDLGDSLEVFAMGSETGGYCRKRQDQQERVSIANDCVEAAYSYPEYLINEKGKLTTKDANYYRLQWRDTEGMAGPYPWYESGQLQMNYQNWTGTISYQGKTTPPKFHLNSDHDELEGIIDIGFTLDAAQTQPFHPIVPSSLVTLKRID